MRDPSAAQPSPTQDEVNQRIRFRRFLLASTFSLVYVVVLGIFHTQGKVDRETLVQASAIATAAVLVFLVLFRSGLNLRFPDPSLTELQFLAAVSTMLFVVYRAPDTRLVFAAFFFVALMFGMLRSTGKPLTVLGWESLACFALMAGLRYVNNEDVEMLRLDLLQLVVMAVTFPWFVFIGRRVIRLREADRRKDVFLASLAHELRNPLAPIRTGVAILRMTGAESRAPTVLAMMERQLQHMARLLDDLLDVSRISRGKITLHTERIDLREVVEAAVETNRPLIEQMGHAFSVSAPSEPAYLKADAVRFAQIISNLLNNAAKYTPPGGRIALKAEHLGDEVQVSVTDNGIGISGDSMESIFEMFTQIGSESSNAQGGLGIGLSLAKGLVALHGGTIQAYSAGLGRGSEFRVRVPTRLTLDADSATPARTVLTPPRLKVLVVDDNRDAAESLSMLLEMKGHEVRRAYDGENALLLAEDFRPEMVLLDLGMPKMNGYEACRRIRDHAWGTQMTLIAVTGWGQEDDRRKSTAAGFDGHLVKPVDPETLEELSTLHSRV
ncbi:MAG TPA: ATP-binding protein [Steroidobacteraceae bacterium]|nr:ATP-binding protein [Steroidobacteraceae bacterium]